MEATIQLSFSWGFLFVIYSLLLSRAIFCCSRVSVRYTLVESMGRLARQLCQREFSSNSLLESVLTMRFGQFALFSSIVVALTLPAAASTRKHVTAAGLHKTSAKSKHTAVKSKMTSQRTIDDERATQIQAALIKAGYLAAPASGHWDSASIAAMTKVQADNGWQTKLVPDSRALIKLGLGPATAPPADSAASLGPAEDTIARNQP